MKAMKNYKLLSFKLLLVSILVIGTLHSCKEKGSDVTKTEIVTQPEDINATAKDVIKSTLEEIVRNDKDLPDSFRINNASVLQHIYDENLYAPLWSSNGIFNRNGDSLFSFITHLKEYGLFPEDYYHSRLANVRTQLTDTSKQKKLNASLWAYSDLLLSSAFVQIVKDLKVGRLLPDSVIIKDSTLTPVFFADQFRALQQRKDSVFEHLEPRDSGYLKLKLALRKFLLKANFKDYTFVSTDDSTRIPSLVLKRLSEEDSTLSPDETPDSSQLTAAIKKYQKENSIKADGKISAALIERLNNSDEEKFIRIAINLDRYKLLPPMPEQYIFVNIPAFYLRLMQSDTLVLKSRVVVGKPITRTPIITSSINNMITYPKWTIPESIIKKEVLPGLQRDPSYTIKKGYSIVDEEGNEIDPYSVKWTKYKEGIPYKVVQGSGDDNALGVLKFNFPNKFSVYLHDTNQRYLFSNKKRALSHGCVRVQAWNELAKFILRNDSLKTTNAIPVDSLSTWLETKQKKYIPVRRPIPLFIRYFTCDVSDEGKLVFYEDVYGEDMTIREKIFANKIL
jgi:murein L,D-transpeptidase YcbB/YkuD